MSQSVDERIVALHFENQQFEKGAKESLKTLEELKKGLDFEGVSESFGQISKATEKGFGLKNTTRETNLFTKALKGLGNVAAYPFQAMAQSLNNFNGYLRTYMGFDLASKLVNTGRQVIKAFTIDPLQTGWNEYELKMDSIKTIMTGTQGEYKKILGDQYTEEAHLEIVKNKLEDLNKYADETIYSFQDMTSNIGKFTNNGVELDKATTAIMGVSNAAAQAGQGTNEASRAMYNLSQAIGMGKLTTIDWKSIENANMATLEFKDSFIKVGEALGTLRKQGDKYFTTTGKKLEVTAENFRETLQSGWINKDVMVATLAAYSGEYSAFDLMKDFGLSEAVAKELAEIGQSAKQAAMEVRTFSKMWDALREAAQSGWAISWELIFGDMKEGSTFWTELNNRFSKMLEDASNKRNDLLRGWRGQVMDADKEVMKGVLDNIFSGVEYKDSYGQQSWYTHEKRSEAMIEKITSQFEKTGTTPEAVNELVEYFGKEYNIKEEHARNIVNRIAEDYNKLDYVNKDGRVGLTEGIKNIIDSFVNLKDAFTSIKTALYGEATASGLQNLTDKFQAFTEKVKNATVSLKEGKTFEALKSIFMGLNSAFQAVLGTVKKLGSLFLNLLSPVGKFMLDIFAKIGNWLTNITGPTLLKTLSNISDKLKGLTKIKIAEWFKKVKKSVKTFFTTIGKGFTKWLKENGFEKLANALEVGWEKIKKVWDTVKAWKGWESVGKFFVDVYTWIKDKYGKVKAAFTPGANGETSKVAKWLTSVKEKIITAWNTVIGWDGWKSVGTFLSGIWGWIKEKYSLVVSVFNPDSEKEDESSRIVSWINNVKENIETAWNDVKKWSGWKSIGQFFTDIWGWIKAQFKPKTATPSQTILNKNPNKKLFEFFDDTTEEYGVSENSALTFFKNIWTGVTNAWNKFKTWVQEACADIGQFLTNTWAAIKGLFTGDGAKSETEETPENAAAEFAPKESKVTKFFETIWAGIVKGWDEFKKWVQKEYEIIGQFLTNTWAAIKSLFSGDDKNPTEEAESSESVAGDIAPTEGQSQTFFERIWEGIVEGWEAFKKWVQKTYEIIGKFLTNTWAAIKDLFTGKSGELEEAPETADSVGGDIAPTEGESQSFFERIWEGVVKGWDEFKKWVQKTFPLIGQFLTNTWAAIKSLFAGENGEITETPESPTDVASELGTDPEKANSFFATIWSTIATAWTNFINSDEVKKTIEEIGKFITETFAFIADLFKSNKVDAGEKSEVVENATEDGEKKLSAIEKLFNLITEFVNKVKGWDGWPVITEFIRALGTFFIDVLGVLTDALKDDALSQIIENVVQAFLEISQALTKLVTVLFDPEAKWYDRAIAGAIALVLTAIVYFFRMLPSGSGLGGSWGTNLMGFGIAILAIAEAISIIGKLDSNAFWKGVASVTVISVILLAIIPSITTLLEVIAKFQKKSTGVVDRIVNGIIGRGTLLIALGMIMNFIPKLIYALSGAQKRGSDIKGDDILKTLLGISALLISLGLVFGAMSLISKIHTDAASFGSMMLNLFMFVTGLITIVGWMSIILNELYADGVNNQVDIEEMKGKLRSVVGFFEIIGETIGGFLGSLSGAKSGAEEATEQTRTTQSAINSAKTLFEAFEDFSLDDFNKLERIIDVVSSMTKKIADPSFLKVWFSGEKRYSDLPEVFDNVAIALGSFIIKMNETFKTVGGQEGLDAADKVFDYLESIARIAMMASLLDKNFNGYSTADLLTQFLIAFTDKDWNFTELQESAESFSSLADMINQTFVEAAPNIDVMPLIHSIASGIASQKAVDEIKDAFTNMGSLLSEKYGIDTTKVTDEINKATEKATEGTAGAVQKAKESVIGTYDELKDGATGFMGFVQKIANGEFNFSFVPTANAEGGESKSGSNFLTSFLGGILGEMPEGGYDFGAILKSFIQVPEGGFDIETIAREWLAVPEGQTVAGYLSTALFGDEENPFSNLLTFFNDLSEMEPEQRADAIATYIKDALELAKESLNEATGGKSLSEYLLGVDLSGIGQLFNDVLTKDSAELSKDFEKYISTLLDSAVMARDKVLGDKSLSEYLFGTDLSWAFDLLSNLSNLNTEQITSDIETYLRMALDSAQLAVNNVLQGKSLTEYLFGTDISGAFNILSALTTGSIEELSTMLKGYVELLLTSMAQAVRDVVGGKSLSEYLFGFDINGFVNFDSEAIREQARAYANAIIQGINEAIQDSKLSISQIFSPDEIMNWLSTEGSSRGETVISFTSEALAAPMIAQIISSTDTITSNQTAQTTRIVSAISALSTRMSGIETAISGISIVLDTGAVAGAVDKELGKKSTNNTRTTYTKPPNKGFTIDAIDVS